MSQAKQETKENELATAPVGKLLFRLALPTVCAQVVNLLYNIVDRLYIGRIPGEGARALTGMGVTFPIIILISAFAVLVGMGGAPRASIALGENDKDKAERTLGTCAATLVALSIVLTIAFLLWQKPLLMAFGASADTLPYGLDYLNIYVLGTVFVMCALGLNGFIIAQGNSSMAMKTVLIGAGLNVVLDPIFIFALGMGVRGAAIATVISQAVSAAWAVRFLVSAKSGIRLRREYLRLDWKLLAPALALGASPFIMQATESLLTVTFNVSLKKYGGDLAVGSMTILSSVAQILMMPLMGIAQGAQPILSYNLGARNTARMKQCVKYLICASFVFSAAVWLVVQLAPGMIAGMFSDNRELVQMAAWGLRIYLAVCFIQAFQQGFQQAFVSLGEAKISLFLALERKIILLIPLILILPRFFENKLFAVFLAEPIADFLAALTTTVLFSIRFRQIVREIDHDKPRLP